MLTDCFLLRSDETAAPAAVFPSAQASPANWRRLDYLARGNPRQRSAHALLSSGVWDTLERLCQDLALVSTVAIGLDLPGSDLDILCQHPDPARLAALLREQGWTVSDKGNQVWLMEQTLTGPDQARWPVELYVTPARLETLNGWRHLSLMAALLGHFGHDFHQAVLRLRLGAGLKGEAAICRLLGLCGDPYVALLTLGLPESAAQVTATALVVVLITYFSIVVGELVPKRIGQSNPETLARLVARPIDLLAIATKPFVLLLSASTKGLLRLLGVQQNSGSSVTEEEIHAMLEEGTSAGVIESHEHTMVRNVFRLDDRQIGSLMVPRSDVVTLDLELSFEENMARVEASDHPRYPVVLGDLNNVVGIVNARRWLSQALRGELRELAQQPLQEPLYVPETITGMELLDNFRSSDEHMAFVIDEYGEIQGIVTLHDLIEAITGEFRPRDPHTSWAVQREDGSWLLDGLIPVPELKDRLGLDSVPDEERGRYHTLSGMMMLLTGRLPRVADSVSWEGWQLEIVDMDGRIIDKVLATRLCEATPAPATGTEKDA